MLGLSTWKIDQLTILTRREIATVLADLARKAPRSAGTRQNRIIFRLACCCGLRASEIAALRVGDVRVGTERPNLYVRADGAKGGRVRRVPLWWDRGTLEDVTVWRAERVAAGAGEMGYLVASPLPGRGGIRFSRHTLRKRFRTACKVLGTERLQRLTIHHGRHTFVSHALAGGRTLAEVRDAAGHTSVLTTSIYLHVAIDDDAEVGELFR